MLYQEYVSEAQKVPYVCPKMGVKSLENRKVQFFDKNILKYPKMSQNAGQNSKGA